jgi:hypothetical protein
MEILRLKEKDFFNILEEFYICDNAQKSTLPHTTLILYF